MKAREEVAATGESLSLCSLRIGNALYGIDTRLIREVLGNTVPQRVPLAPDYIAGASACLWRASAA